MTRPPAVLLLAVTLLAGCKSSRYERIQTRRDPTEIEREKERNRDLTPAEIDERFIQEQEKRELTLQLRESLTRLELTHDAIRATLGSIGKDPWISAEADRKRVLYRKWADHPEGLAPVEPEPPPPPIGDDPEGDVEEPAKKPPPKAEGEGEGEEGGEGEPKTDEESPSEE